METVYYEKTLSEAKEYMNSLEAAREKLYRAAAKISAWLLGINTFLAYRVWQSASGQSLYLFAVSLVVSIPCLTYLYKLFFAVKTRKISGTEPKDYYSLENAKNNHIYIEYINNYQDRINHNKIAYEAMLTHYTGLLRWFLLFIAAFVSATIFVGLWGTVTNT